VDDLEDTLDALERRLRALQAELDAPGAPPPAARPPAEPPPAREPVAAPPSPSAPGADALDAFADDLRATTARLVSAYDAALAAARGAEQGELFDEDVALEARTDLPGLCALAGALRGVPGVHAVDLRAYAGGHAVLDLALDRPVGLVRELRDAAGPPIAVLEARPGRLAIEVGATPPAGGPGRR
jgi:hypothetical protein